MKPVTLVTVLLISIALSIPALAKPKPKTKTFPVACSALWPITKAIVKDHYDVLNLDDQTRSGSFTTGSVFTGVRPLAFSLSGNGNTCTVAVTGHYSGLIHNDKGDLFKRIENGIDAAHAESIAGK